MRSSRMPKRFGDEYNTTSNAKSPSPPPPAKSKAKKKQQNVPTLEDNDQSENLQDWSLEKLISTTMKFMSDSLVFNRMEQDTIKDEFQRRINAGESPEDLLDRFLEQKRQFDNDWSAVFVRYFNLIAMKEKKRTMKLNRLASEFYQATMPQQKLVKKGPTAQIVTPQPQDLLSNAKIQEVVQIYSKDGTMPLDLWRKKGPGQ